MLIDRSIEHGCSRLKRLPETCGFNESEADGQSGHACWHERLAAESSNRLSNPGLRRFPRG